MNKRGIFIVLEGLDRSGKSSQCKKLFEYLTSKDRSCEMINFPNREIQTGKMINDYLKNSDTKLCDEAIHLLFSTNRWEMKDFIHDKIKSGVSIICDRYAYSGVAYSHAKGLDFDWWVQPDKGLPQPDLVLFVNTTAAEITSRSGFGDERYEREEFQEKVYEAFQKLRDLESRWHDIEGAGKDIEEIYSQITEKVNEALERVDEGSELPNSLFKDPTSQA